MDKKQLILLQKYWGDIRDNVPQSKYWEDVSPLSHRDRRPCAHIINVQSAPIKNSLVEELCISEILSFLRPHLQCLYRGEFKSHILRYDKIFCQSLCLLLLGFLKLLLLICRINTYLHYKYQRWHILSARMHGCNTCS